MPARVIWLLWVRALCGVPVVFGVAPHMPRTLKTVVTVSKLNPGTLAEATRRVMDDAALRARLERPGHARHRHIGAVAAKAIVRAERAKWTPIVGMLGDLSTR